MLRCIDGLKGYKIKATDGVMGKVEDILVEDENWHIRYIVVQTGSWLNRRKVLIIPQCIGEPQWMSQTLPVNLTMEEVRSSPPYSHHEPISRVYERMLHSHYVWTPYFSAGVPGPSAVTVAPMPNQNDELQKKAAEDLDNNHLRSITELQGYRIEAEDGEIGSFADFIMDDEIWLLRYIVVDTGNWFSGKKVLIAMPWLSGVEWATQKAFVDLKKKVIEEAPEFNPAAPINRKEEVMLYDFYGRPRYWD